MTDPTHADYNFAHIEKKWQKYWLENKTFRTEDRSSKPKYYILDMFPYPSGDGLHVGHPEGYTATDIVARYKRMMGFNVLHPMGWDAFGLPAEQHAVRTGTHPSVTTGRNVDRFREQIRSIGLSYDWDREINTTDPNYYRWTQWIFRTLFERGLAYESFEPVNWCPELGTVLANEEVIDGKSEVGGFPVVRKPMRQWVLKITAYADRLIDDLELVDWPEPVKEMQRNWIGKSIGAEINFKIKDHPETTLTIFTTRPDTLFGATFCVIAPEHPLAVKITTAAEAKKVAAYVEQAKSKSDIERQAVTKEKSGVFTGAFALNPANGEPLPIYVADYVLISYGHGAIMAVPAHDTRDHSFAKQFALPIKQVIKGGSKSAEDEAYEGDGILMESRFLNGKSKTAAVDTMCEWLVKEHHGQRKITYRLRDWLFSRQRYWGEPIPLVLDNTGKAHAIAESELPLVLPELEDFKPSGTGESPLAKCTQWLDYQDPKGRFAGKRETNTMPQWAGSCWYYLRFIDPKNDVVAWDKDKEKYWMPVDLYVGGVEHAVLHLLYARFWHKVLFDCGLVSTKEPFQRLVNQGMILGDNGEKMSKSRGNVVNPDDVIREFGADSLRLYEMFMGPLEAAKPWQTNGIVGVQRFLKRVWRLFVGEDNQLAPTVSASTDSAGLHKLLHKTIKKVTEDIEGLRFNTAIAAMMELINAVYKDGALCRSSAKSFLLLLAPFAPHLAEEVWEKIGVNKSLSHEAWPSYDPALVFEDTVTISVQVNGKLRGTIELSKQASKDEALAQAKSLESVTRHLGDGPIKKEIYVPGKIINFVV